MGKTDDMFPLTQPRVREQVYASALLVWVDGEDEEVEWNEWVLFLPKTDILLIVILDICSLFIWHY